MGLNVSADVLKSYAGEADRPDAEAMIASGLFDCCVSIVAAFEQRGPQGVADTDVMALHCALAVLRTAAVMPQCEAKIRGIASALSFCLANDLEVIEAVGLRTGAFCGIICAGVFGRDEEGAEFSFTQEVVDTMLTYWCDIMRATNWGATATPGRETILALELTVSDVNKQLLLANADFIPYLVESLMLDPEHPRAGLAEDMKIWLQNTHAECLAQLAVYPPGREALLAEPAVCEALQAVVEQGMSEEGKELARNALLALSDVEMGGGSDDEGQKHLMIS